MKFRPLAIALVPALGLGSLLIARNEPFLPPTIPGATQPASRPASPPINLDKPADLERTMKAMDRLTKSIARQIDDKSRTKPRSPQ